MLQKYSALLLTIFLVSAEVAVASNSILQSALEKQSLYNERLGITANLNEYLDETLQLMVPLIQKFGLDPMLLPELEEGFEVKPILITYSAKLKIHDGFMTGISNIARDGDQTVNYFANMLRIRMKLKISDLDITYKYLVKVMKIGPTGGIKASLKRFSVLVDILIDFNNDEIQLQEFGLTDVGKVRARLTGNILVDWLINPVISVFVRLFDTVIIKVIESNIRTFAYLLIAELNNNIKVAVNFLESFN